MAYNYEEKLILHCLCQEKKFYHQRFVRKRFLHKLPISIAPLKSQMVGPLAGAVTAFACGKINEYFGFWLKNCLKATHTERLWSRLRCTGVQIATSLKERRSVIQSGPFNLPWSRHLSCHSLPYYSVSYHDAINVVRLFKPL